MKNIRLIMAFVMALTVQEASAVAYCAVRDPVSAIQQFFPDYTSYEAVDGAVDMSVRDLITEKLPNVHFSEFGTHTLYVVFKDSELLGYVHARTEKGDWGLDELIWALSPSLSIKDFRYQRSRSMARAWVESDAFVDQIRNLDVDGLVALLNAERDDFREPLPGMALSARDTSLNAVRSAIKTILITDHVWPMDSAE
jgi:hypothetical protein